MPHLLRVRVISICLSSANMYLTLIGVFPYTNRLIAAFELKPQNCYERLLKIVNLGSNENTIDDSIEELRKLCKELKGL